MPKNIFSLSYGKDSISQIILALEKGVQIDEIVTVDMRFDEKTSAFLDYEIDFVNNVDNFLKTEYGLEVKHLPSLTFKEHFYRKTGKGFKHEGEIRGWPTLFRHSCVTIKRDSISHYLLGQKYVLFIGICYDEEKRYHNLRKNQRSLLYELKYTQNDTFSLCKSKDLLSPTYCRYNKRNGCFFCPFQPISKLRDLVNNYPSLYQEMYTIGLDCKRPFHLWEKKHLLPLEEMRIKLKKK